MKCKSKPLLCGCAASGGLKVPAEVLLFPSEVETEPSQPGGLLALPRLQASRAWFIP